MLSIGSGGIWPRRTPACGGLRGATALAYGGSRRAMALSMQPPQRAAALSARPLPHAAALSMQPPRRARVFGRKTDAPLVLGQDLDAQSAPSVRKSPGNAFSVRISPKNERRIQNAKLGNVKLGAVKLGQSHFDRGGPYVGACALPLRSGLVHASERVEAARIAYIR